MKLERLARRRAALVERSAAQRADIEASLERARNAAAAPVLLGAGGLVAMVASSPALREWLVRAWAVYALVRRFRT